MAHFDVIVVGTGAVGSAALLQLAQRGAKVLGLDRFEPGHAHGSSHGQTRLIRQAYYEHPSYVPLVQRAFELWHQLEQQTGQRLYQQTGLLQIGEPEGEVLRGVRASAKEHGLEIENLTPAETRQRFPGLELWDDQQAVFETRAGYLLVERCVATQAALAQQHGARLQIGETVVRWQPEGQGVVVETDRGSYWAKQLVVTAGAWAGGLLADLGIPFEVRRKPLFWFAAESDAYRAENRCPAFLYDLDVGCYYGFPAIDSRGVKLAEHSGGAPVQDPLTVDRSLWPDDERRVRMFKNVFLPKLSAERTDHAVCLYTMTSDAHFVVDRHPRHPQVCFAAGLSGHGFKFAPALGEALADLALRGQTDLPIGFLSASRAGLRPS